MRLREHYTTQDLIHWNIPKKEYSNKAPNDKSNHVFIFLVFIYKVRDAAASLIYKCRVAKRTFPTLTVFESSFFLFSQAEQTAR
jgi:hypothetical protein